MSKIASLLTLLVTVLVCLLPAVPVQAQAARTFVSAAGSDSNNCTNVATPCRHLAAAYAATAANGEIYVLDPANYGSLTITGPVSIEGHGWASIAPVANGNAITINANPGEKINIIGVVLDGTALHTTTGIRFNSGGSLNIQDSVIRNFTLDGILFLPSASGQLFVSNTVVSDNGNAGIDIFLLGGPGAVIGVVDHVVMQNNSIQGININPQPASTQTVDLTIADSVTANNGSGVTTISANGKTVNVMVRNSTIANNSVNGLVASGSGVTVWVTRSTITGNGTGWLTGSGATFLSYGDNNEVGNTNDNGTMTQILYK